MEDHPIIEIQNIVASASLEEVKSIWRLEQPEYCQEICMEPEQFPGLIHRMSEVFKNRNLRYLPADSLRVCTCAKKETELYRAVTNFYILLEEKNLILYET